MGWSLVGVVLVAGIIWLIAAYGGTSSGRWNTFAKCLAEKKITMYGDYRCPHCQNEKRAFGDSFKYVPYVECTQEPGRCAQMGVKGYPTWIFEDQMSPPGSAGQTARRLAGEQGLTKLSQASGCLLVPDAAK